MANPKHGWYTKLVHTTIKLHLNYQDYFCSGTNWDATINNNINNINIIAEVFINFKMFILYQNN